MSVDWQGDCGDVVASLWPRTIAPRIAADGTEAALNVIGSLIGNTSMGTEMRTQGEGVFSLDFARMLDGEYRTDPAQYTATATGMQ